MNIKTSIAALLILTAQPSFARVTEQPEPDPPIVTPEPEKETSGGDSSGAILGLVAVGFAIWWATRDNEPDCPQITDQDYGDKYEIVTPVPGC